MVRRLPVVDINGKSYFYDEKLRQLRNIYDPNDFIDLFGAQVFMLVKNHKDIIAERKYK